jgi:hypothetical protein
MFRSGITYLFCLILLFTFTVFQVKGQDLPVDPSTVASNTANATLILGVTEVSLLKASEGVINLQLNQRAAGQSIETTKSDSTARLLISSVISTDARRVLSVQITSGSVPSGTKLQLSAMQPNANFVGEVGTFASPVTLTNVDMPFITDIATCYSGTEATDGYPLKFIYGLDNYGSYGSIRAQAGEQVVVTFTLTAAQ